MGGSNSTADSGSQSRHVRRRCQWRQGTPDFGDPHGEAAQPGATDLPRREGFYGRLDSLSPPNGLELRDRDRAASCKEAAWKGTRPCGVGTGAARQLGRSSILALEPWLARPHLVCVPAEFAAKHLATGRCAACLRKDSRPGGRQRVVRRPALCKFRRSGDQVAYASCQRASSLPSGSKRAPTIPFFT
jgi:hypothetical protein